MCRWLEDLATVGSLAYSRLDHQTGDCVQLDLDDLITIDAPADLSGCTLGDLRAIRDHHQDVENGLSYARRVVQGRMDTLAVELEMRNDGAVTDDLLRRLPDALAAHSRGPGLPRPMPDLEPPAWAHDLLGGVDEIITPAQLADISDMDDDQIALAAAEMGEVEQQLSTKRHELHRIIDRIQDELVGRYRQGASVDDLLS